MRNDKEYYEERIKEIKSQLGFRAIGTSSRMLNDFIEKFFQEPIGTRIEIYDHYHGANGYYDKKGSDNARRMMCLNIRRRLENEYPNIEYELTKDYHLIRKTKTYNERLLDELSMLEEKLKEYHKCHPDE